MHVVIVGAGVMGCATALALAERGAKVTLLERAIPGAEASSAAAGILGAQRELHEKGRMIESFVRARREYAAWAEELRAKTGIDIGHRVSGALVTTADPAEKEGFAKAVDWQSAAGLRAELLDAKGARAIEPELTDGVAYATYYPDEAQVDPPSLLRALVAAVARAGVAVKSGATVQSVIVERDVCVGVKLDDGEARGDAVVLAAGSWSSLVPGVPAEVPQVKPARGQIVLLDQRPPKLRTIVMGGHTYAVPRGDGRVLCGSTVELVGFKKEVTAGGVHGILRGVIGLVPSLADAAIATTWSAFRPFTEGDAPLVGPSPLPGLFLATGHFRNGILLAKTTADEVAAAVVRG
jgi:glycine oxidase